MDVIFNWKIVFPFRQTLFHLNTSKERNAACLLECLEFQKYKYVMKKINDNTSTTRD